MSPRLGWLGLALLVWLPVARAEPQERPDEARVDALLAALEAPGEADAALTALIEIGSPAAARALTDFAQVPLRARRARSLLVREAGREDEVPAALACLDDPDLDVRTHLVQFLARPELRDAHAGARVAALAEAVRADPGEALRRAALEALARIDDPSAVQSLEELLAGLVPPWRARAARALGMHARARDRVVELVRGAFDPVSGGSALPDDVLGALLGASYGPALAELPAGGTNARDLAPFALAARHPDPLVRRESGRALAAFVARLRFLGDIERAERALDALQGSGLDDGALFSQRARLALQAGDDPRAALEAARALSRAAGSDDSLGALLRRSEGQLLETAAHFAAGAPDEARAALEAAGTNLDTLLARRDDRGSSERVDAYLEALERRGLVELYRALALLWTRADVSQPAVLAHARRAHEFSLRSQLVATRTWSLRDAAGVPPMWSLDSLIDDPLGPWGLVFGNDRHPHVSAPRALELQRLLLTALASVAPLEVPGFAPVPAIDPATGDPRLDPARSALLHQILEAHVRALREMASTPAHFQRSGLLMAMARQLERQGPRDEAGAWTSHLQRRMPSDAALPLAEEQRAEGRLEAARSLTQRLLDDLRAAGETLQALWGEELVARAEVTLGAIHMDADEPAEAERLFTRALERLLVLEEDLAGRGAPESGLASLRARRADVLVSLAVNANVKLQDTARALEYFERAYALRQVDDYMRVLLACYRARAGREAEARAVLGELPVSPYNYYNLACTYALLGEVDLALDFLRRDFAEMRASPGQLERQKEWARGDPDLARLRGDARFERLVAPAEENE